MSVPIIRYIVFEDIEHWLAKGWLVLGPASAHSVLMGCLCECEAAR
jgi:hypothetical protein